MPFQNRVDPWGRIFRSTARGSLMGNRGGALHSGEREIVRQHKGPRWIACLLAFRGRQREVMTPGRYTELFVLDEAVSFAAGHRPCAECRRPRFREFVDAWRSREGKRPGLSPSAPEIDAELHRARIDGGGRKVIHRAAMDCLPNGTFVEIDGCAYLVRDDAVVLWSAHGYVRAQRRPNASSVTVLTPAPLVECFRAGLVPDVHDSGCH